MVEGSKGPKNLLLVEDNPRDARLVEEAFEDSSFDSTIHHVTDSHAAIQFLARDDSYNGVPTPDIVLLDWNLAETTGEAVLRTTQTMGSDVPVVVMTSSQARERSLESKIGKRDICITKPHDPAGYVEAVRSIWET